MATVKVVHEAGAVAPLLVETKSGPFTSSPATALVTMADFEQFRREMQQRGLSKPGSATYSQTFNQHPPSKIRRLEAVTPAPTTPPFPTQQPMSIVNTGENEILLPRVLAILRSMLGAEAIPVQGMEAVSYNGVAFVDTHRISYLAGTAPDITIVQKGYGVTASTALAVLELQSGLLDNHHRGKLLFYMKALLNATPGRLLAKGALFNGRDLELFEGTATSTPAGPDFELHQSQQLVLEPGGGAWPQLWMFLLSGGVQLTGVDMEQKLHLQYGWKLPRLYAQADDPNSRLQLTGLIACSRAVHVWEVQQDSGKAVCKQYYDDTRLNSYNRERAALDVIKARGEANQAQGRNVWPQLLSASDEQRLLLTQPLVKEMDYLTNSTLQQLFAGIRFLHDVAELVHRDLEDKHVGLAGSSLCVIDLSTCVALNAEAPSGYSGTVINASDDVLDGLCSDGGAVVVVRRQQDVVALVKTVYALTHPHRRPAIHAAARQAAEELGQASDAAARSAAVSKVRSFWSAEFAAEEPFGQRWRGLVEMAHVDTQPGQSYEDAMSRLESKLIQHACCR